MFTKSTYMYECEQELSKPGNSSNSSTSGGGKSSRMTLALSLSLCCTILSR